MTLQKYRFDNIFWCSTCAALLGWLLFAGTVSGQQKPSLDSLDLQINTVNTLELHYVFTFSGDIDRAETLTHTPNQAVNFKLIRAGNGEILASENYSSVGMRSRRIDFTFPLDKDRKELISRIYEREEPVYLALSGNIEVIFAGTNQSYVLTPDEAKTLTLEQSHLSSSQLNAINAYNRGTSYELKNNLDFNREVGTEDSAMAEYVFNFDIVKSISSTVPLFVKAKGRMSTNSGNPLNYSEFYLSYRRPGADLFVEAGRIGRQDFSTNSLRLNLGLETLLPNLVDLTGGSPRLRLKPYLKAGLAFQKNFGTDNAFGNDELNLMVTAEGYYYIPLGEQFFTVVMVDGNYSDAFRNDKFRFAYDLSIGYQTPLNDLKLLFQVQSGENEVNRSASTRYLVGLLMNFIK